MNRFFTLTLLTASLLIFAACDSKPTGIIQPAKNRMSFNDHSIELQSAFSLSETDWEYGRMWGVALYPDEYEAIPANPPRSSVSIILPEELLNREIDLTKPFESSSLFSEIEFSIDGVEYGIYREGTHFEIWFGDEEVHGTVEITSGKVKIAYGEDTISILAEIAFSDGNRLSAVWDGPFVGKSPSSETQPGTVYGTMHIEDLSSELRSGLFASYDIPDFGKTAFLILSPESELTFTDLETDFEPSTALVVQMPQKLLGQQIDLSEPIQAGTFDETVDPAALLFLSINRSYWEIQPGVEGWIGMDGNGEEDQIHTISKGTFQVTRTHEGNTLRLDATLSNGTRITAAWDGPVEDISGHLGFESPWVRHFAPQLTE